MSVCLIYLFDNVKNLVKKSLSHFLTDQFSSVLHKIQSKTVSSWKWRKSFYADVRNGEFYELVNVFPVSSWRNWHPCLFLEHPNIFRPSPFHWHDRAFSRYLAPSFLPWCHHSLCVWGAHVTPLPNMFSHSLSPLIRFFFSLRLNINPIYYARNIFYQIK